MRSVEEMESVKYVNRPNMRGEIIVFEISGKRFLDDGYMEWQFGNYNRKDFLPATLDQYTQYINSKK